MLCSATDRRRAGFSLIEIMVVVAVIAILAAVAYPSYRDSVRKAKRAEAQALMLEIMQQQERYYSQRHTYIAFSAASVDPEAQRFKWFSGRSAASSAYEIQAVACGAGLQECVALKAIPGTNVVDGSFSDPVCGTLTFASTGEKGAGAASCWN